MRPSVPPWLYWLRVRKWPVQEALAGVGIATGVALLFAVQVANSSVTGSVEQLVHGITGTSKYALVARDQQGFSEGVLKQVQADRDVRAAAPLVVERASVGGPSGRTTVELVGVTLDFAGLSGNLVKGLGGLYGVRLVNSLLLPEAVAAQLGVGAGDKLRLHVFGRALTVRVAAIVGKQQIGSLADSPVVVGPLSFVQALTGLRGRVTHILVAPRAGRDAVVHTALTGIASDRLDVVPSDNEARLIKQAAGPNEQSTGMFAAISMVVGVLFTFNAMLLTVPERRRFIAELRMQGFSRAQLTTVLLFEAIVLGTVASLLGLLLGDQLSRHFFHAVPGYLSFAFPVGHVRIVSFRDLAIAFGGGILAILLATARPLWDVLARSPLDVAYRTSEEPSEGVPQRVRRWMPIGAAALGAFAAAVLLLKPASANLGIGALGLAMVLVLPSVLIGTLGLADRASFLRRGGGLLSVAVSELRASTTRAIALAATGALAVFGSVAIEGAHRDLLRGLDANQAAYVGTADVWVSAGGDENSLTTAPFAIPGSLRALAASGVVAAVRPYRGGFLDVAGRRAWIVARDPSERAPIPAGQMVDGSLAEATARLRHGGAVVASVGLADHLGVRVGDDLRLPSPSGTVPLRLVATTNNLGWSPGTLLLNGEDYRRLWATDNVTAAEVDFNPGTTPAEGRRLVQSALGPGSALTVETAAQRLARLERLSRQGLDRLSQISTLMLVAAAIAMAAAMSAAVWQQRRRLAVLRMQGFDPAQVWRVLLLQSALVLSVGAALGAIFGLAGQVLATRWTSLTTGFPSVFSPAFALAGLTFAGVAFVALVAVSAPGYAAARVSPSMSFQND
jgi:putative ABC transport system permease protein